MHHIQELSIGTEFTSDDHTVYKVNSNFSDEKKIYVELLKVVEEKELELIEEP